MSRNIHYRTSLLSIVFISLFALAFGCNRGNTAGAKSTEGTTITVAAAADLKFALEEVVVEFQKAHPSIKVTVTYGSSGNFYSQLSNKAPFDIYFSADIEYPRKLVEAGLAIKESQFHYAVGQIVVWVLKDSAIEVEKLGMESVASASAKKVAIANPEHAPYGRAAEAAMKSLGVHERIKDRLVLGENIAQTAQFVETGAADVGVIALSLALAPTMKEKGKYWLVPIDSYPRLEQGGVILSWAKNLDATKQFRTFVTGDHGRALLKRYGFILPGE